MLPIYFKSRLKKPIMLPIIIKTEPVQKINIHLIISVLFCVTSTRNLSLSAFNSETDDPISNFNFECEDSISDFNSTLFLIISLISFGSTLDNFYSKPNSIFSRSLACSSEISCLFRDENNLTKSNNSFSAIGPSFYSSFLVFVGEISSGMISSNKIIIIIILILLMILL